MNQSTIDRAVRIATRNALKGKPVRRVIWIPPLTVTDDPAGSFMIEFDYSYFEATGNQ